MKQRFQFRLITALATTLSMSCLMWLNLRGPIDDSTGMQSFGWPVPACSRRVQMNATAALFSLSPIGELRTDYGILFCDVVIDIGLVLYAFAIAEWWGRSKTT